MSWLKSVYRKLMANQRFRMVLPILGVLVVGGLLSTLLIVGKPKPDEKPKEIPLRVVRVIEVEPGQRQAEVISQGTVTPRVEIVVQPEVFGRIVEVSEDLVAGGFFAKNDVLFRIDPRDYELAVVKAEARVAEAQQFLARERAESEQARKEWSELGTGPASPLVLREPQLKDAQAKLKSARASLDEAKLRLERSTVRAPFNGRVREKHVDIGQVVSAGTRSAQIYATDRVEVRLPLTDRQIALLDLPMGDIRVSEGVEFPTVDLRAEFAGAMQTWQGRIVRTEGAIDTASRVLYAVAEVQDPYKYDVRQGQSPLSIGLFVEAAIKGRVFDDVIAIPREAVQQNGTVLVVDSESRLHIRMAKVVQSTRDEAIVRIDLEPGERVCVSPLETATENMEVEVFGEVTKAQPNVAERGQS